MNNFIQISKPGLWTGSVLKVRIVIFLFVETMMKLNKHPLYVNGTIKFDLPESSVVVLGTYLFIDTILYILPTTAIYGILFLVAYKGVAVVIVCVAKFPILQKTKYFSLKN